MFYKRTLAKALAMAALSGIIATGTLFAAGEPTSLDADSVEYDMASGVVTATGDVLMVQGDLKVTGQQAQYNSKTKEGSVEGNVIAVQSAKNMRVTAQKVTSDAQQHMVATGNVYGTMEDKSTNIMLGTAKGGLYEALVADFLIKKDIEKLYFYKNVKSTMEVEFLITNEDGVIPIEVKAGKKKANSLNRILESGMCKYGYKLASQNVGVIGNRITLPLYMLMFEL